MCQLANADSCLVRFPLKNQGNLFIRKTTGFFQVPDQDIN